MAETPAPVALELASLKSTDGSPAIEVPVHFNPASLQYTVQNQEQGQGAKKKQHVSETSAKLTMDLVFDTTDTGKDVRLDTQEIVKLLSPDGKSKAPRMVEFSWGAYTFTGLIEQYKETLDFFSAGGVPLRASVNLTLASKEVTFADPEKSPQASVDSDLTPQPVEIRAPTRPGGGGQPPSPASVATALGTPRAARAIAAANGAASLRFGAEGGLTLGAGGGVGLGAGIGASAAVRVGAAPGAAAEVSAGGGVALAPAAAFSAAAGVGGGLSTGVGIGAAAGAGIGAGAGGGIGIGSGAGLVAGGAFGGLRAAGPASVTLPDPRSLIEAASRVSVGAGAQFAPGGRALSAQSGASLSAAVGANDESFGRVTFGA